MNLIERAKAILLKPAQTWPVIDAEPATVASIYKDWLVIMAAIPADSGAWAWRPLQLEGGLVPSFLTGIGRDAAGELYLLVRDELGPTGATGRVLRLVPPGG